MEVAQRSVLQGIGGVFGLLQVGRRELVGVDDDHAARGQVAQAGLERRRVHRNEHLRLVAWGKNILAGQVHLEAADAGQRADRRANFGRKVRHGADIVADDRCGVSELCAGELHAVAGVARKADNDILDLLDVHRLESMCHICCSLRRCKGCQTQGKSHQVRKASLYVHSTAYCLRCTSFILHSARHERSLIPTAPASSHLSCISPATEYKNPAMGPAS